MQIFADVVDSDESDADIAEDDDSDAEPDVDMAEDADSDAHSEGHPALVVAEEDGNESEYLPGSSESYGTDNL